MIFQLDRGGLDYTLVTERGALQGLSSQARTSGRRPSGAMLAGNQHLPEADADASGLACGCKHDQFFTCRTTSITLPSR